MINNVTLVGRLTKDPELKYTPSNIEEQMPGYALEEDDLPFQCEVRNMVGVTYQEIHLFVEFLKEQYGQGRPDYIEALNDLDGLVEVSYREAIERFLEDEVR